MIGTLIGIVGAVLAVLAIWQAGRYRRIKSLVFQVTRTLPLATAAPGGRGYELTIQYRPEGGEERTVNGAFATLVGFANVGREPIRALDLAPGNPLRIAVEGDEVLQIEVSNTNREVCGVEVGQPLEDNGKTVAHVRFDFLDHNDGAIIRILSAGPNASVELLGDIVGMPGGIRRAGKPGELGLGRAGTAILVVLELLAFGSAAAAIHWRTGDWSDAWLLLIPFVALILPVLATLVGAAIVKREPVLPRELSRRLYIIAPLSHALEQSFMLPPPDLDEDGKDRDES